MSKVDAVEGTGLRDSTELAKPFETALSGKCAVLLHHLAHLQVLLQDLIYFLHGRAAATSNTFTPLAIDQVVIVALGVGHRIDDRLNAF